MSQKGYVFRANGWWWLRYFETRVETGEAPDFERKMVRRQHASKLATVLPEHSRLKRPPEYVEQLQKEFLVKNCPAQMVKNLYRKVYNRICLEMPSVHP